MTKKAVKAKKIPARPAETLESRLMHCAGILYIHGYLTSTERRRVGKRMQKARERNETDL